MKKNVVIFLSYYRHDVQNNASANQTLVVPSAAASEQLSEQLSGLQPENGAIAG